MSLCFTAGTLYVRADNLYVSTSPLMHCVYKKVADGCLVNDTEDRLPPSFSCSEDLSLRPLQDTCQLTGTEVLQCCLSYVNPPVSWDYTCCTSTRAHQVWKYRPFANTYCCSEHQSSFSPVSTILIMSTFAAFTTTHIFVLVLISC